MGTVEILGVYVVMNLLIILGASIVKAVSMVNAGLAQNGLSLSI